jgi:hypothetical protein
VTIGELYLIIFAFGAGASIAGFWAVVLAKGLLPSLIPSRRAARIHVAAELLSAALLIAAGTAMLLATDDAWSRILAALALGTLVYALLGSPGLYEDRRVLVAFMIGWVFTIPAIIVLFAIA